jgi:cytochrome c-type biogenesis protein
VALILESLNNTVLGPVFALLAGILASASPCAMAAIPIITGHMVGTDAGSRGRQLLLFVLGMATSLSLAGMVAGLLGKSILFAAPWIRWVAGIAFIAAGFSYMGIISSSKTCKINVPLDTEPVDIESQGMGENVVKRGSGIDTLRPLGLGMLYGLSASPCATPALLAILAIVASSGSVVRGGVLLLAYSLGQSALVVSAGLFVSGFRRFLESEKNVRALEIMQKAGGAAIAIFGLYLILRPYL